MHVDACAIVGLGDEVGAELLGEHDVALPLGCLLPNLGGGVQHLEPADEVRGEPGPGDPGEGDVDLVARGLGRGHLAVALLQEVVDGVVARVPVPLVGELGAGLDPLDGPGQAQVDVGVVLDRLGALVRELEVGVGDAGGGGQLAVLVRDHTADNNVCLMTRGPHFAQRNMNAVCSPNIAIVSGLAANGAGMFKYLTVYKEIKPVNMLNWTMLKKVCILYGSFGTMVSGMVEHICGVPGTEVVSGKADYICGVSGTIVSGEGQW